jgi:hypothetical protein
MCYNIPINNRLLLIPGFLQPDLLFHLAGRLISHWSLVIHAYTIYPELFFPLNCLVNAGEAGVRSMAELTIDEFFF